MIIHWVFLLLVLIHLNPLTKLLFDLPNHSFLHLHLPFIETEFIKLLYRLNSSTHTLELSALNHAQQL